MQPMPRSFPDPVRATVIVGARSVDYLAAGSGPPVLLFARESRRSVLVQAIGRGRRVICPILEEIANEDGAEWLNDFLDGLGLENIVVMIDESCASLAASLQEWAGHRFKGLFLTGGAHVAIDTGDTPASVAAADPEP